MALPGPSVLSASILALPKVPSASVGGLNFAKAIGDYMKNIQAGSGSPGIITFNESAFASSVSKMPNTSSSSWPSLLASNWGTALLASTITPGTVKNPIWTASQVDSMTSPSAASTVITASAAQSLLATQLAMVKPDNTAPLPMATAFHNAMLALQFNCIGLAIAGPSTVPIPIVETAQ